MQVAYCTKERAYDFSLNITGEDTKERHRSQLKGLDGKATKQNRDSWNRKGFVRLNGKKNRSNQGRVDKFGMTCRFSDTNNTFFYGQNKEFGKLRLETKERSENLKSRKDK